MQSNRAVLLEPPHSIYQRGGVRMADKPKKRKSNSRDPVIILPPKVYIQETGETVPMNDEHRAILAKKRNELFIKMAKDEVMKELGY